MTNVIQTWFTEWLKLWTIRNEDQHGRDQPTKTQADNRQAMRELQQFYANHDGRVHDRFQGRASISNLSREEQGRSTKETVNTQPTLKPTLIRH
jgi:hypothetical protein